jgi:hypothetical protein
MLWSQSSAIFAKFWREKKLAFFFKTNVHNDPIFAEKNYQDLEANTHGNRWRKNC